MSWYDTLLFLHVLGAFAVVATVVVYGAVVLTAARGVALVVPLRERLVRLGGLLFDVGGLLTLAFGVWLAIYVDAYELWDGWILAAFPLWLFAGWLARRFRAGFALPGRDLRLLYGLLVADVLAFLLLMIFKPGA